MRKFFTFFAVLFIAVAAYATEDTKTLYCKVQQSWWTDGSAAVGIYAWGEGVDAIATWPGVRMEKVEGQPGVWKYDLPTKYTSVIFTRVNPNECDPGDTKCKFDWGAKTQNLTVPTDDKDLFTITSESAVWGDPGADGEWSVFVPVTPVKFYITGSENLVGEEKAWHKDAITVTADSYTFENLAVGTYQLKVITADDQWIGFNQLTARQKTLFQIQPKDNNICFTLAEAGNVTVNYVKDGAFTVDGKFVMPEVSLIGIKGWTAPDEAIALALAADSLTASVKLTLDATKEFKVIVAGSWISKDTENPYELKREVTTLDSMTYAGGNLKIVVDKVNADYTFTYNFATGRLTVDFPVLILENGFYLVGKFNGEDAWNVGDLTAAKKFEWNAHIGDDNEEWKITADLKEGDKIKAAYVYYDAISDYTPAGEGNEYVVDADHAGDAKTIYFQQLYNNEWQGHFYIEKNEGTAIDNTDAAAKATKVVRNGMLLIEKNGHVYNVLGTMVK